VYTKIIVPLDGSLVAEGILPYVRTIARASNAAVELLNVLTPVVLDAFCDAEHDYDFEDVEADMRARALAYLRPIAATMPHPLSVECAVRVGEPAVVIVEEAGADALVIMATHGRSGAGRWLLGSVADKVVHSIRTHLLLARAGDQIQSKEALLKTVVVPLDGSSMAEKVLPAATALAKIMHLEIVLLRVYSVANSFYASDGYVPDMSRFIERVKEDADSYLNKVAEGLKHEGLRRVSCVLREGDGAAKIIDYAREKMENLVVMSTHGRSGIRRLMGTVTDRVVRYSWDPVLIIPPALANAAENRGDISTAAATPA
jgi:nucleotide-binding universal stress UspA family protein